MPTTIPKVSITVVTYNHGRWLAQCLESIITQKTSFPFEIIIGDDASTDHETIKIIKQYADKYPDIVKPILRKENIGPWANYLDVAEQAKGAYIAHIDGDDYMYPNKIQYQADFLNTNPEYTVVCHKMDQLQQTGKDQWIKVNNKDVYPEHGTVYDLLKYGCYFCHSSKMYRRSAIITRQTQKPLVDYYLHIEHALHGKIYYSQEVLGCYRIHNKGISKNPEWSKLIQEAYESAFDRALEIGIAKQSVESSRIRHYHAIALTHLANRNLIAFKKAGFINQELYKYTSFKHKVIHYLTFMPKLAYCLLSLKQKLTA